MTGTFIDTIIVCSITGLALVTTGAWTTGMSGVEATTYAFQSVFGQAGSYILAVAIILFAYSTILGWAYYGEKCFEYLFGFPPSCPRENIPPISAGFASRGRARC